MGEKRGAAVVGSLSLSLSLLFGEVMVKRPVALAVVAGGTMPGVRVLCVCACA